MYQNMRHVWRAYATLLVTTIFTKLFWMGKKVLVGALWRWYLRKLDSRPLVTQAATTGFVCGLGDAIAQFFIERRGLNRYNLYRTARMASIGFFFTGPVLRGWFLNLDKGFGPTKTIGDAVKKVVVDQCMFAPVLTAILVSLFGFTQGLDRVQVREKVKKEYLTLLLGGYLLWPAAQFFNFYCVPLKFRVNYANLVSLIWNSFVGYVANRDQSTDSQQIMQVTRSD